MQKRRRGRGRQWRNHEDPGALKQAALTVGWMCVCVYVGGGGGGGGGLNSTLVFSGIFLVMISDLKLVHPENYSREDAPERKVSSEVSRTIWRHFRTRAATRATAALAGDDAAGCGRRQRHVRKGEGDHAWPRTRRLRCWEQRCLW